ncbi:hypothetical protein GOP47_0011873 [Adiantum capillus-veneris]|uniref:Probable purine permease n=1 Tax=Adiantum capillus-veneris TaxID=13818 RepID=A0A9D4ZF59_ADICA|nr:hypothetical protein GOP47_0011177 [Adiantum capillus-veneris]KAI5073860.1 hypothetical protein GOP47_0011873 [Adiantum capillus-veneris]
MADHLQQGKPGSIVMLTRGNTIKLVSVEDPGRSQIINVQSCEEITSEMGAILVSTPRGSATAHICNFHDATAKMAATHHRDNSAAKIATTHQNLLSTPNGGAKSGATHHNFSATQLPAAKMAATHVDNSATEPANLSAGGRVYFGKRGIYWLLMISCSMILLVGTSSATLLGRLYFMHGGSQRWLYTCMQSAGWPVLIPPLLAYYFFSPHSPACPTPLTFKLFAIYLALGFLTAFDNLLFSWGLSYLPVSTNALLCASQLAFNAIFAYALVGQKITHYIANSVFAITVGAVLLGLHSGSDRPAGTTEKQYVLGFVVTLGGAALYALMLPLLELTYKKVIGKTNFAVVVEVQIAIAIFATMFSIVGMGINGEFSKLGKEARTFTLGPSLYIVTLVGSAIGWQMFFLGGAGIIFLASSLLSCVFATAMLPLLSMLAVIFFHDSFSALKAVAMLLSIWGFVSYIYGGYLDFKGKSAVEPAAEDNIV